MKTIKEYVEFAMENGYEIYECEIIEYHDTYLTAITPLLSSEFQQNYIELITTKEFIEAIAIGIRKEGGYEKVLGYWMFRNDKQVIQEFTDEITKTQAIAIRDGKLEDFITELLNKGNLTGKH